MRSIEAAGAHHGTAKKPCSPAFDAFVARCRGMSKQGLFAGQRCRSAAGVRLDNDAGSMWSVDTSGERALDVGTPALEAASAKIGPDGSLP